MQDIESSDISCHNVTENEAESPYLRVFNYLSERPFLLSLKLVVIALAALQRYVIGPQKYHAIFSTNKNYEQRSRPFSRAVHRLHVLEMWLVHSIGSLNCDTWLETGLCSEIP